jgi:ribonuclease BN (tRNA processing enzyme)
MARMKLRILGVNNMESDGTRMAGYVINDVLALDAGSTTRSLTFDEQRLIEAVLITHEHNDHVRDLPTLRHNISYAGGTFDVYALPETLDYVTDRYLPESNVRGVPRNAVSSHAVDNGERFTVGSHEITAMRVHHSVPGTGYHVSDGEASLFYTGDTGPGLGEIWRAIEPDALLIEVTFGDENHETADSQGHLTPCLLEAELKDFHSVRGYFPRVIVTHMNPPWEAVVRGEIAALADALGADISVANMGETLDIRPVRP